MRRVLATVELEGPVCCNKAVQLEVSCCPCGVKVDFGSFLIMHLSPGGVGELPSAFSLCGGISSGAAARAASERSSSAGSEGRRQSEGRAEELSKMKQEHLAATTQETTTQLST